MRKGRGHVSVDRAFLLAGRATRLPGKFLLPIDGEPLVYREVRVLRSCGLETAVVSVVPLDLPDVPVLLDHRDAGPLGGLAVVLEVTDAPFFLFGADMPFLDPAAIETMRASYDGRTLVPQSSSGHLAVLHAIYSGVSIDEVGPILARGGGLVDLVRKLARRGRALFLPPGAVSEQVLRDIDTPEDLARTEDSYRRSPPRPPRARGESVDLRRDMRSPKVPSKHGKRRSK